MECFSRRFQQAVVALMASEAAVPATIPLRPTGFIQKIQSRSGTLSFHLRPSHQ